MSRATCHRHTQKCHHPEQRPARLARPPPRSNLMARIAQQPLDRDIDIVVQDKAHSTGRRKLLPSIFDICVREVGKGLPDSTIGVLLLKDGWRADRGVRVPAITGLLPITLRVRTMRPAIPSDRPRSCLRSWERMRSRLRTSSRTIWSGARSPSQVPSGCRNRIWRPWTANRSSRRRYALDSPSSCR